MVLRTTPGRAVTRTGEYVSVSLRRTASQTAPFSGAQLGSLRVSIAHSADAPGRDHPLPPIQDHYRMPRKFIKRYLPDPLRFREHRHLQMFGRRLQDPNIWHLNRHTVAGGVGTGVFIAFLPIPFQMVIAAAAAIMLRINLPLSVVAVWVSNPLTMAPMLYFSYRLGNWLLGGNMRERGFEPTLQWFWVELHNIWQPLLLGSVICGALAGLAAYGLVHLMWRLHIRQRLRLRRRRRG